MRDAYYKSKVLMEAHYDRVIDWIKANNQYIQDRTEEEKEEFATSAVHSSIRSVLYGDNRWSGTGMCLAVEAGPLNPGKVLLTIQLL